ncbi:uncharacterized protein VTP21DRAFT_6994 [Calcarisporiella thermophila]|uniref:uncharacterized protein n=1 Tax=Calcarisporiella thermophila TaxID=911321 RepID=UPI003742BB77
MANGPSDLESLLRGLTETTGRDHQQYINRALAYLLDLPDRCWWRNSKLGQIAKELFYTLSLPTPQKSLAVKSLLEIWEEHLGCCMFCVKPYYRLENEYIEGLKNKFEESSILDFQRHLAQWNASRIHRNLESLIKSLNECVQIHDSPDFSDSTESLLERVRCTLYELFLYDKYLGCMDINALLPQLVYALQQNNFRCSLPTPILPGLILIQAYPDSNVRTWARLMLSADENMTKSITGEDLEEHERERIKQALISLLSIMVAPTRDKIIMKNENTPFNLEVLDDEIWSILNSVFRVLPENVTIEGVKEVPNFPTFILQRMREGSGEYLDILAVFNQLLLKLRETMWELLPKENPVEIFRETLSNPQLRMLINDDQDSDVTENAFGWIHSLILSVIDTNLLSSLTQLAAETLLVQMQEEHWPLWSRAFTLELALDILLYCHEEKAIAYPISVIRKHSKLFVNLASNQPSDPWESAHHLACILIETVFTLDARKLSAMFVRLHKGLESESVEKEFCSEMWSALGGLTTLMSGNTKAVLAALYSFSRISLLDPEALAELRTSEAGSFVSSSLVHIRNQVLAILQHISDQSVVLPELLKEEKFVRSIVRFLVCSDKELRSASAELLKLAFEVKTNVESFRILLVEYQLNTVKAMVDALESFTKLLTCGSRVLCVVAPFFNAFQGLLTELLEGTGWATRQIANELEVARLARLLWRTAWFCFGKIADAILNWSMTKDPKIDQLVAAMQSVQAAVVLFTNNTHILIQLARADNEALPPVYLPLDSTSEALDHLHRWLYANDRRALDNTVPLICVVINILADGEVNMGDEAYKNLQRISTDPKQSVLSDKQRKDLAIALSAYDRKLSKEEAIEIIPVDDFEEFDDLIDITDDLNKLMDSYETSPHTSNQNSASATSAPLTAQPPPPPKVVQVKLDSRNWKNTSSTKALSSGSISQAWKNLGLANSRPAPVSRPFSSSANRGSTTAPKGGSKLNQMLQDFKKDRRQLNEATRFIKAKKTVSATPVRKLMPIRTDSRRVAHDRVNNESDSESDSSDDGGSGLLDLVKENSAKNKKAGIRSYREMESERRRTVMLEDPHLNITRFEHRNRLQYQEAIRARLTPSLSGLHKTVLSWDLGATGPLPPNISRDNLRQVPDKFSDVDEYVGVFEPLLILECWQQLLRAKEETNAVDAIECKIKTRSSVDDFTDITFQVSVVDSKSLGEHDLLYFTIPDNVNITSNGLKGTADSKRRKGFMGKVQSVTTRRDRHDHQNPISGEIVVRSYFGLKDAHFAAILIPGSSLNCIRLFSLVTVHREYAALHGLAYYDLCECILNPTGSKRTFPKVEELEKYMRTFNVNQPQAEAIIGAIRQPSGFTLIQGPPGTGKTKTTLSLIGSFLSNSIEPPDVSSITAQAPELKTPKPRKLLVCAPSNAAVDEIVKRLKAGILDASGEKIFPRVVRIGAIDKVSPGVLDLTIERLVESEMNPSNPEYNKAQSEMSDAKGQTEMLREALRKIANQRDERMVKLVQAQKDNDLILEASLESELKALNDKKRRIVQRLDAEKERSESKAAAVDILRSKIRSRILDEADIICTTLSGSGHELLTSFTGGFGTVIIDEAAQSVELSSLIPLKYRCRKCIMVGDPNQLPPTVLSQLAAEYSYEQSLFVRIQKNCPESVYLLSIQYRMHPDISYFPSRLFYESRLTDGPHMKEITQATWHSHALFGPYRFFDVHRGREAQGVSHSLYNTTEALVAANLLQMLATEFPKTPLANRVGVITPYKQQLRELKRVFESRFGKGILSVVDFNTVDGFQGQEKDIIIFSCVRASGESGVGFLADVRRMNVGLTRARSSIFILGHAKSLLRNRMWKALVLDAEKRKLIISCDVSTFGSKSNDFNNLFEVDNSPPKAINLPPEVISIKVPKSEESLDAQAPVRHQKDAEKSPSLDLDSATEERAMQVDQPEGNIPKPDTPEPKKRPNEEGGASASDSDSKRMRTKSADSTTDKQQGARPKIPPRMAPKKIEPNIFINRKPKKQKIEPLPATSVRQRLNEKRIGPSPVHPPSNRPPSIQRGSSANSSGQPHTQPSHSLPHPNHRSSSTGSLKSRRGPPPKARQQEVNLDEILKSMEKR